MKIISHRGNLDGPTSCENSSKYIEYALNKGFHVEIDVWSIDHEFYLGHDYPQHRIHSNFIQDPRLLCHAKNLEALIGLLHFGSHCFWHENDDYTMTSEGVPVVHCGKTPVPNSIWVQLGLKSISINNLWGICTDYPYKVQQSIEK